MEHQLCFVPKLSLEEMSLRRVVINQWNSTDILAIFLFKTGPFKSVGYYENEGDWREKFHRLVKTGEEWRKCIETAKNRVSRLVLPKSLKKRMMHIVKAIGSEMLRWKVSLHGPGERDSREHLDLNMLKQLCWTSAGLVDYQKTAEILVCLETLDIVIRFKLACSYFLVNHIPVIWGELPKEYKRRFNEEDPWRTGFCDDEITQHELYWSCVLMKLEYKLDSSINQKGFVLSARTGNKAATEYYFQKLSYEERDTSLFDTVCTVINDRCSSTYRGSDFPKENLSVVLCYLLPLLNSEQQMKVFKEHPYHVLRCFLDWPCQDLLDIVDLIGSFLPEDGYKSLLSDIAANIRSSGFYFPKFLNFFLRSPSIFDYFVRYEFSSWSFFPEFFFAEDIETITLVFRSLNIEDRLKFVTSEEFFKILNADIMRDKCDLVELCLREIKVVNREQLKYDYMEFLEMTYKDTGQLECSKRKWNELFDSL